MSSPPKMDRVTMVMVALLLLGAALMGWQELAHEQLLEASSPAPDFTVATFTGGQLSLSELQGQVVVVDFWATWCGPCREEMPMLVQVARELEAQGVRLVAISNDDLDEQREAVAAFVASQPQLAPYAAFGTPELGRQYLVHVLPTLYVIDRRGRVVGSKAGQISEGQLRRWIDEALARDEGASAPR